MTHLDHRLGWRSQARLALVPMLLLWQCSCVLDRDRPAGQDRGPQLADQALADQPLVDQPRLDAKQISDAPAGDTGAQSKVWAVDLPGLTDTSGWKVAVGSHGNVYVAGLYSGKATLTQPGVSAFVWKAAPP